MAVLGHLAAAGNEINAFEQQQLLQCVALFAAGQNFLVILNGSEIVSPASSLRHCLSFLTLRVCMQGTLFFIFTTISPSIYGWL